MKRVFSLFLALIVVFCTISSVTTIVYADYDARLTAYKKINKIIQDYVDPSYHLDTASLNGKNETEYKLTDSQKTELKNAAKTAVKGCKTDYQKISAITEYVATRTYYDYDYLEGRNSSTYLNPYKVFQKKRTVCDGYARLTKVLLNLLNIPCVYVVGFNHAYNIAYDSQNDKWIYLDSTWCSGNDYRNGKRYTGKYNSTYFDMSLKELASISNHEVYFLSGIAYSGLIYYFDEYSLTTWENVDEWTLAVDDVIGEKSSTTKVSIKSSVAGLPVTSIESSVFSDCKKLKTITIPDSVTYISTSAFENCTSLSSVKLSNNIKTISSDAFKNCKNLTSIELPDKLKTIESFAFQDCTGFTEIMIPKSVRIIEMGAFSGCTSLSSITIPDTVTSIGECAFDNTAYYKDINNWEIDSRYNDAIDWENEVDYDALYVLYIGNHLIKIDWSKKIDYAIKPGVKSIAGEAFSFTQFKSITIPDGVIGIGEGAFEYCENLASISIPDSVKRIDYGAFYNSKKLKNVHYSGSISQWKKIKIDDENENLIDAKIHFGVIEKPASPTITAVNNKTYGIKVSWDGVLGADSYRVYRKVKGGSWTCLGTTSKKYFNDKTVESGVKYYYAIKAENDAGRSSLSKSFSKLYLVAPSLKTPTSTKNGITLKWSKTVGAEGYIIYRKTGSGSYTKLKTEKGVSNRSYVDASAKKGKNYTYKVKAYSDKTYSSYSNTKTIKDKY